VKENELWRIRRNDELDDRIKGENIVRFIKRQRIRWLGHIEKMQDTAIPKKMYGKLYATRRRGRPKTRWLDDVYGPTFDNAESRLFLFAAQCFNTE
jgi:hypothetical protein